MAPRLEPPQTAVEKSGENKHSESADKFSPLANHQDAQEAFIAETRRKILESGKLPELHIDDYKTASTQKLKDGTVVEKDDAGRVSRTTDSHGRINSFEYKGDNKQPSAVTIDGKRVQVHGDNPIMSSKSDNTSYVSTIKVGASGDIVYGSDDGDRVIRFHDGAQMDCNNYDQVQSVTDQNGHVTTFEYDNPETKMPSRINGLNGKDWVRYQGGMPSVDRYAAPGEDTNVPGTDLTNLNISKDGEIHYTIGGSARHLNDNDIRNVVLGSLTNTNYVIGRDGQQRFDR